MTSSTASVMGEHVETDEEKNERVRKARAEGAAKARAVLAEKRANGEIAPPRKKVEVTDLWQEIFITLMRNREVRSVKDVPAVIKEANAIVDLLEEEMDD